MKKRLWLTSIPEDYDARKDILLGPWCVLGKEHQYTDLSELVFEPDPFTSSEDIIRTAKLTRAFAESYLLILSNQLNNELDVGLSIKSWRFLLMPWLLPLVQITWMRQKIINHAISKYRDDDVFVELAEDSIKWEFVDTFDFVKGTQNVCFNYWLFSRLLERRVPDNWNVVYSKLKPARTYSTAPPSSIKTKIANIASRMLPVSTVYGVNWLDALLLEMVIRVKSLLMRRTDGNVISHKDENISLNWNLDWDTVVSNTLPKSLSDIRPTSNRLRRSRRLMVLSWSHVYYDDKIKKDIAILAGLGAKLIAAQHGGSYGTNSVHSRPAAIEYMNDAFFSWGWQKTTYSGENIIPTPSPLLSKFRHKQTSNKIIFVNGSMRVFPPRLESLPQPNQLIAARNNIVSFISMLDRKILADFWYRPFFSGAGQLLDEAFIVKAIASINILKGKLHDESMKCKLLVLNTPDTTLNIALAANIPTLCFWDPNSIGIDLNAEPYFAELKRVGIIYDGAAEAAQRVNDIWDDVDGWWQQGAVQAARKEWAQQYARTSKHWRRDWIELIWKL